MTRGHGHVADRLIGEDRDPTPAESAHLDTCPECFGAVRRRRPFDVRLADAARDLVIEPLPREVLLVDDPTQRTQRWWTPAGIVAAFLLVVALGVGGYVAWSVPGRSVAGDGTEGEEPIDNAASGLRVVEVPGDDLAFTSAEGGVMIVTRLASPAPQILAKVPIPVSGSVGYAMVCPWSDDLQMGFVYGVVEPGKGPPIFVGPEAAGTGSDDGLFLFAFNPFEAQKWDITVTSADGTGVAFGEDVFSTLVQAPGPNVAPRTSCADWNRAKP